MQSECSWFIWTVNTNPAERKINSSRKHCRKCVHNDLKMDSNQSCRIRMHAHKYTPKAHRLPSLICMGFLFIRYIYIYTYMFVYIQDSRLSFVFIIFLALVRALSFTWCLLVFLRSVRLPVYVLYACSVFMPNCVYTGLCMNIHAWLSK